MRFTSTRARALLLAGSTLFVVSLAACGSSREEVAPDDESDPSGTGGSPTTGTGGSSGGNGDGDSSSNGDPIEGECDVPRLFETKCAECHGTDRAFADLDLIGDGLEGRLLRAPSVSCADWALVVAGSPERSFLFQKVASDSPPCGERMPIEAPLSATEVECVAEYIRALAPPDEVESCETCGGLLCLDVETDANHCGECDRACETGEICVEGSCEGCPTETTSCSGGCVDLLTDSAHCGGCGNVCGGGQVCVDGVCECASGMSVSLSEDIQPLFERECTTGCHDGSDGSAPGGRPTNVGKSTDPILSEGQSHEALVGVTSGCDGKNYVEPGDVSSSYLMNKLLGTEMCGGSRMPKGQAPLSQDDLDLIGAWICSGAADD